MNPACASACPTGALSFGNLRNDSKTFSPGWFPDRNLNPSLSFTGTTSPEALRIEPESRFSYPAIPKQEPGKGPGSEWSLIVFSFLSSISVAYLASSVISGTVINALLHVLLLVTAASASLYHLGKPGRAWRALINLKTSPLSREIWGFLIYSLLSSASLVTQSPLLTIIAVASGLVLLVLIDGIYYYADQRIATLLNSGQTLLTALLISSFLAGEIIAFLFIAGLRLILSVNKLLNTRTYSSLRFVRIGVLTAISVFLPGNYASLDSFIFVVFLTGELIDRVLFYIDFSPLNISKEFSIPKI